MGIFAYFFAAKATVVAVASSDEVKPDPALDPSAAEPETLQTDTPAVVLSAGSEAPKSEPEAAASDPTSLPEPNQTNDAKRTEAEHPNPKVRRFNLSFRSLSFVSGSSKHKSTLSAEQDRAKKIRVNEARAHRLARPAFSASSTKRAKQSALLLRSLMVGPSGITPTPSKTTKAVSKPQLSKVKSQLLQPKSANKVIAQLRALPVGHGEMGGDDAQPRGPIHAVCLEYTEEEVDRRHFAQLAHGIGETGGPEQVTPAPASANIATASVSALTDLFRDMHLVNLINAPDLGLGQPPDGEGLLAGALPTAETVIKGIKEITPQLLALGFATGRIMVVDHTGVCPPTDRMSVLTYWWGLELALPPPTLVYLANAQSISTTVVNFLSALSLVNNGVREILPFVRYIAQFIDYEFNAIRGQNRGKGVVCAATWIMPAAMVPRPWDFPDPPPSSTAPAEGDVPSDNPEPTPPTGGDKGKEQAGMGPGGLFPVPVVVGLESVAFVAASAPSPLNE